MIGLILTLVLVRPLAVQADHVQEQRQWWAEYSKQHRKRYGGHFRNFVRPEFQHLSDEEIGRQTKEWLDKHFPCKDRDLNDVIPAG